MIHRSVASIPSCSNVLTICYLLETSYPNDFQVSITIGRDSIVTLLQKLYNISLHVQTWMTINSSVHIYSPAADLIKTQDPARPSSNTGWVSASNHRFFHCWFNYCCYNTFIIYTFNCEIDTFRTKKLQGSFTFKLKHSYFGRREFKPCTFFA